MTCVLIVPASADRLDEATGSGASVIVADLTMEAGSREHRRAEALAWLRRRPRRPGQALYLRIHDGPGAWDEADLDLVTPGRPDGIMLGDCRSVADVQRLGAKLAVREAEQDRPDGGIGILAVAAASAAGVLALSRYGEAGGRLRALAWDGEALARDLGATPDAEGGPLAYARALTIVAARAAGVAPLDSAQGGDGDRLAAMCGRGRRDGFAGALTREPAQVPVIASAYGGAFPTGWIRTP